MNLIGNLGVHEVDGLELQDCNLTLEKMFTEENNWINISMFFVLMLLYMLRKVNYS